MSAHNRTWLCCVVFLDVVSFTKHHMQAQLAIKSHLDAQMQKLLKTYARDEYILLDRGDGAAVCFLVEPETALYFALDLRDAVRAQNNSSVPYEIRIGINLGPIKIVLDVNGDKTTLGEGINCAARIMDFAGAGQIFVSRSFYEVIGCLSQEYAELFSYLGKRADKHVREFEVYEVAAARTGSDGRGAAAPPIPTVLPASVTWEPEALQSRIRHLTEEIGPMARILVQRTAQKAGSLEELDRILATPDIRIVPDRADANPSEGHFDRALLDSAARLLGEY
ncbi:MAG TPA: adenylate/guanylate cyclase domain-containing protein, partial [Gammaproteobacteria bacterium]|nr:adenylate/guanylate cyclase domain-containing protein [Gammaproteobacteria bacterium]